MKKLIFLLFFLLLPFISFSEEIKTVDIVLQIKAPYNQNIDEAMSLLAQQSIQLFNSGGNPNAQKFEEYLGYVNTPVTANHIRVRVGQEYARIIELIGENEIVKLVRVEWPDKTPEGGWEPITFIVQCYDLNNQPYPCIVELGRISH